MTDAEVQAVSANIDANIATLNQFLRDCRAIRRMAKRYPVGTKLGNAIALAQQVFLASATGVGEMLDSPRVIDPQDATEFVR